jgi:hypothetical protein
MVGFRGVSDVGLGTGECIQPGFTNAAEPGLQAIAAVGAAPTIVCFIVIAKLHCDSTLVISI